MAPAERGAPGDGATARVRASERHTGARRVTISDIARRAGVSKGAVSYALNDRPGLSEETRARILRIADELGWYPSRAARALSNARANACGFVIARPAKMLALEPYFMEFAAGVESVLSGASVALTIQLVDDPGSEVAVHRRWWGERRVDGVLVVDPRIEDPRFEPLAELALPAIVVGGPLESGVLPSVWQHETSVIEEVVRYLAALGHRRVGRVAGVTDFLHTKMRSAAFLTTTRDLALWSKVVDTDFTPESGARATRQLLSDPEPPTAIVYDSAVLAVTGLGVAHQMGFAVPDDLSIVAWDDSLICQVVHPPLTAVSRDIVAYGSLAAGQLLKAIAGEAIGDLETPAGVLVPRASTGLAPQGAVTRSRQR
jgi:DNA-binding LacI/PurR family transcriptional regulator